MRRSVSRQVELGLMIFDPDTFFPRYFHSVDDVALHRSLLRSCRYTEFAIDHLADLVLRRVEELRRRNLLYGLQAIKWMLKNAQVEGINISKRCVDRLFELYQQFVFDPLESIQWCISAVLKDKVLRPAQIRWLLDNHQESDHVVNRLLKYPAYSPLIASWARTMLNSPKLQHRTSEVLSRLITGILPPEAAPIERTTVVWAIYYSPTEIKVKERLLKQCVSEVTIDALVTVSLRLQTPSILRAVLKQKRVG